MTSVTFRSWRRSSAYDLASPGQAIDGRLRGTIGLTARDRDDPSQNAPGSIEFAIAGPRDVGRLRARAIRAVYPEPDATDVETTFSCTAELAAEDLPWRYSPVHAAGETLAPWIVLVVGTTAEVTLLAGQRVRLSSGVLADHPLEESPRWAHIQEDEHGSAVARLLSPRELAAGQEHVAVVVPAFDGADPSWGAGDDNVELPVYHHWRFLTGPGGDFLTLTERLRGRIDAGIGDGLDVVYGRLERQPVIRVPAALQPVGAVEYPTVAADVRADAASLAQPGVDGTGRRSLGPPTYGESWHGTVADRPWGEAMNTDPALRIAAGLGAAAAFALERRLIGETIEQAGDFAVADQTIARWSLGAAAAARLWERRMPTDAIERLTVLGPALDRMVTDDCTCLLDEAAGAAQPLPPELYSGTAQRLLRPTTSWAALAQPGATGPDLWGVANACHPTSSAGTARDLVDDWSGFVQALGQDAPDPMQMIDEALLAPECDIPQEVLKLVEDIGRTFGGDVVGDWQSVVALVRLLQSTSDPEELVLGADAIVVNFDARETFETDLGKSWGDAPCVPVDNLDELADVLDAALDPRAGRVGERILSTFVGVEDLGPPELQPYLRVPMWTFLRDHAPAWLLPGIADLPTDTMMMLEPNARFVEAFMVGANTRFLEALRRYDLRIQPRCTALKCFWGRFADDGELLADIADVEHFDLDADVGNHVLAGSGCPVLVMRSELFGRYPDAQVYLVEASRTGGGEPDFESFGPAELARSPVWPTFQGGMTDIVLLGFDLASDDVGHYWIVIEEGPRDRRFRAGPADDTVPLDGASHAIDRLTGAYRVAIPVARLLDPQP